MEIDGLVLPALFILVALAVGLAICHSAVRPVGFLPAGPSRRDVGIVLLATTFVAVLVGIAFAPIGSAALSAGPGALFMSIIVRFHAEELTEPRRFGTGACRLDCPDVDQVAR